MIISNFITVCRLACYSATVYMA